MRDYTIRGVAAGGQIRFFAITAKETVEEARKRHGTSPVVTAALGRLLCGGAMMGAMMKGEKDLLTLRIQGDGPVGGLTVTADAFGHVKGYALHPVVHLPASPAGKLDVGRALGEGVITVIRDIGMREPYSGQVKLVSGEIAADLTYYFAASEQTPSSVALGVLMNRDNTVAHAGGYIIQLMPDTEESVIAALEQRLAHIRPVTALLSEGYTPEQILEEILDGFEPVFAPEIQPVRFLCNCSKERMERGLITLGTGELDSMIADHKPIVVNCHFCNTDYTFSEEELTRMRNRTGASASSSPSAKKNGLRQKRLDKSGKS